MPPTSAASTTRGIRMSQRIDSSVAESDEVTPGKCSFSPIELSTGPIPSSIGPTSTPIVTERTRNAAAAPAVSGVTPRGATVAVERAAAASMSA